MSAGWGLLGLDPQALQQTPQTPQGIPTGADQAATAYGLPSLSSVINGMQSGATGDAQAVGDMGGRIGGMLKDMVGRTGDLVERFRSGDIGAGEFLKSAAQRAGQAAYAPVQFSQDFINGKVDPQSDEAIGGALGMAGIAMTGGIGGAAVKPGETVLGAGPIRAYHGSPHDFDKFSMSAIGSGEGAQAYGHGLYFAENEGVAKSYRDALRADPAVADSMAQLGLDSAGGDRGQAIKMLKTKLHFAEDPDDIARYTAAHDLLASGRSPYIPQGHMYEVGIDADPAKMLDWDKPLIGQYKGVQDVGNAALSAVQRQGYMKRDNLSTMTGGDLLYAMRKLGTPADAASDLQAAGVPGVRFLDQGSRWGTAGDKSSNYVTFSDDIVSILRKYGLAGLMGGGSALAALKQNKDGSGM